MGFIRRFTDQGKLEQEALFCSLLRPDVVAPYSTRGHVHGDVFPAIRADRIDFYHKGGNLFSYSAKRGFRTHHKYASVIFPNQMQQYVTEAGLQAISSFAEGYNRIKENCALYSGLESAGVAEVYSRHSCAKREPPCSVVVLDIEVSLAHHQENDLLESGPSQRTPMDRIDLLLLDTTTGVLRFFEAKHYSNGEIRAKAGSAPRIVRQIARYQKQLNNAVVCNEVLDAYRAHVAVVNALFSPKVPLPIPTKIDPTPRLLVFGFDAMQQGKLDRELGILASHQVSAYKIGDISKVNPVTLFRGNPRW